MAARRNGRGPPPREPRRPRAAAASAGIGRRDIGLRTPNRGSCHD
jgi:hypothetical protein